MADNTESLNELNAALVELQAVRTGLQTFLTQIPTLEKRIREIIRRAEGEETQSQTSGGGDEALRRRLAEQAAEIARLQRELDARRSQSPATTATPIESQPLTSITSVVSDVMTSIAETLEQVIGLPPEPVVKREAKSESAAPVQPSAPQTDAAKTDAPEIAGDVLTAIGGSGEGVEPYDVPRIDLKTDFEQTAETAVLTAPIDETGEPVEQPATAPSEPEGTIVSELDAAESVLPVPQPPTAIDAFSEFAEAMGSQPADEEKKNFDQPI